MTDIPTTAPADYVLVPREPTPDMMSAGLDASYARIRERSAAGNVKVTSLSDEECGSVYRAMVNAAPPYRTHPPKDAGPVAWEYRVVFNRGKDDEFLGDWTNCTKALFDMCAKMDNHDVRELFAHPSDTSADRRDAENLTTRVYWDAGVWWVLLCIGDDEYALRGGHVDKENAERFADRIANAAIARDAQNARKGEDHG